ncbi:hypothetical protein KP509_24G022000 [Ceratopteris richardii]|nr:hypothetical protein KP509_24G022000 [Ceratopteris richardii]
MLVECGCVHEAHEIFLKLPYRNEHSWTSLIQGCVEHEAWQHALHLSRKMQEESISFSIYTIQALLKACASLKSLERGKCLHTLVVTYGFDCDCFISTRLISMYATCLSCAEAKYALLAVQFRDVVMWNALMAGYTDCGESLNVMQCFDYLEQEGISPSPITFACALKTCGNVKSLSAGQVLHFEVIKHGFEQSVPVDGTLLYMYSQCGLLAEASHALSGLKVKNVICWTSLIDGYSEYGYGVKALSCLQQMQVEGVCPNALTYDCCVSACGYISDLGTGQQLHIEIVKKGYEKDHFIANSLLDLYGKLGLLSEMQNMFDSFIIRDVFSWNALISGYFQHDHVSEVYCFLDQMHIDGIAANSQTFVFTVRACCVSQDIQKGQGQHIEIVKRGLEKELCIESSLMDMYMKLRAFESGFLMFEKQMVHDTFSWTLILWSYVEQELTAKALGCLYQMQCEKISPSIVTFICALKACTHSCHVFVRHGLHTETIIRGFDTNPYVTKCLIDMYAKGKCLAELLAVFEVLKSHDEQTWTALMAAYAEDHKYFEHVLICLEQMECDQVSPSINTYVCILKAYKGLNWNEAFYKIQSSILKRGFEDNHHVVSALTAFYGNVVSIGEAEQLLNKLPCRNVVSWTALITSFVECGYFKRALKCLETMQSDNISPNSVTLLCALKAASALGSINNCQILYSELMKKGFESDPLISNNLVDTYLKCGYLLEARQLVQRLPLNDAISWTVLITGFACEGHTINILTMLARMTNEGIHVDKVTVVSVLAVCSHLGLVQEGIGFLDLISKGNIKPVIELFTCIADLMARAGQVKNALLLLDQMPFQPNQVMWTSILGACRKSQDAEIGRQAFEGLMGLHDDMTSAHLLMLEISVTSDIGFQ